MPGRYETLLGSALADARSQFEQQFMVSRECQTVEYWMRTLGQLLAEVRELSSEFTAENISTERVENVIVKVAVMAALSDFCMARFGQEIADGG